jgi:hypothetical protein
MAFPNIFPKELKDSKKPVTSVTPVPVPDKSHADQVKELDEQIERRKKELELARLDKELGELGKDTIKCKENNIKDTGLLGKASQFLSNLPDPPEGGLMNQSVYGKKKRGT